MTSRNQYCYHALALQQEEYVYCFSSSDFSIGGGNAFTFSIQFLPLQIDQEIVLFSQEDGGKIGWDNQQFYYESKTGERVSTKQKLMPLYEREWVQLDLTYINGMATFYLNGMEGCQKRIAMSDSIGGKIYRIGESLVGYIRWVKIANRVLTQKEIIENQYQNTMKAEELELFVDFSTRTAADRGRHQYNLFYSGLCEVKDIVRTLTLGEHGVAIPFNSRRVNPGGFETGQFTIAQRIYLNRHDLTTDSIIMANGGFKEGIVVLIDDKHSVKVVWDGIEYLTGTVLQTYEWVDLAITFDGSLLKIYINGRLDATVYVVELHKKLSFGQITIGNVKENKRTRIGQSFQGYIDMVAIFDLALEAKTLLQYANQRIYIYEDHLIALYDFSSDVPCEEVASNSIQVCFGASFVFAENTLKVYEMSEVDFNLGENRVIYSEFQLWEANALAMIIASYLYEQTGIEPEYGRTAKKGLPSGVIELFLKEIAKTMEAQDLLSEVTEISGAQIEAFLKELERSGRLSVLIRTFYPGISSFAVFKITQVTRRALVSDAPIYVTGVMLHCLNAAQYVNGMLREPPQPTPMPDTSEQYHFLKVQYVKFHVPSSLAEGDFSCMELQDKKDEDAIWSCDQNATKDCPSEAAYVANEVEHVKIEAAFYYETNRKKEMNLEISAKEVGEEILGEISPFELHVSEPGIYPKEIELNNHWMNSLLTGKYESQLNWSSNLTGFMGTTYHVTYLLPTEPCKIEQN